MKTSIVYVTFLYWKPSINILVGTVLSMYLDLLFNLLVLKTWNQFIGKYNIVYLVRFTVLPHPYWGLKAGLLVDVILPNHKIGSCSLIYA